MMGFYHQKYGLVNRALKDNNESFSVAALTILMMMKQKGKSIADYNTDCRCFRDFNNSTATRLSISIFDEDEGDPHFSEVLADWSREDYIRAIRIADKVSGYFVPAVILIAIITFFVYIILGEDIGRAINTFVTILVVACPCSLGLATPLAIVVSEGVCANNGILVKKSEILENAQKINTIIFDKTGTLTYGKLKISEIINYSSLEKEKIIQVVGSIEKKSTHPIGKAFVEYLKEKKIEILNVENFNDISGLGITGIIDNEEYIIGNSKILVKYNIENKYTKDEEKLAKQR